MEADVYTFHVTYDGELLKFHHAVIWIARDNVFRKVLILLPTVKRTMKSIITIAATLGITMIILSI